MESIKFSTHTYVKFLNIFARMRPLDHDWGMLLLSQILYLRLSFICEIYAFLGSLICLDNDNVLEVGGSFNFCNRWFIRTVYKSLTGAMSQIMKIWSPTLHTVYISVNPWTRYWILGAPLLQIMIKSSPSFKLNSTIMGRFSIPLNFCIKSEMITLYRQSCQINTHRLRLMIKHNARIDATVKVCIKEACLIIKHIRFH